MSSRYGRNKRRAHRERIEALEAELAQTSNRLAKTERLIATAREDGATAIFRARYLDQETERITRLLAERYGPKLMEAANRLMEASRERPRRPIDFRAIYDPMETADVMTIEGVVPSFHYRVRVAQF